MTKPSVVHATFALERRFELSPGRVFAAWADPEIKARWFAANETGYQLDFRVGGVERSFFTHDGTDIAWESLYRAIVPDQRIIYTSVLSGNNVLATISQATIEFIPDGKGTTLVLTEQGAYLDEHLERPAWREQGTSSWLDDLCRELAQDVTSSR